MRSSLSFRLKIYAYYRRVNSFKYYIIRRLPKVVMGLTAAAVVVRKSASAFRYHGPRSLDRFLFAFRSLGAASSQLLIHKACHRTTETLTVALTAVADLSCPSSSSKKRSGGVVASKRSRKAAGAVPGQLNPKNRGQHIPLPPASAAAEETAAISYRLGLCGGCVVGVCVCVCGLVYMHMMWRELATAVRTNNSMCPARAGPLEQPRHQKQRRRCSTFACQP